MLPGRFRLGGFSLRLVTSSPTGWFCTGCELVEFVFIASAEAAEATLEGALPKARQSFLLTGF